MRSRFTLASVVFRVKAMVGSACALVSVLAVAGTALAAGTDPILFGNNVPAPRLGIIAYCADLYHNAGDTGLQSNKVNIKNSEIKQNLANLAQGMPIFFTQPDPTNPQLAALERLFLDGPFDNLGQYGAQNLADYFAYDDGITRVRDIKVIDGSLLLPTSQQLIQNFDIIVAYTDNKCGEPIPANIANSAASALSGFIAAPGKKLILTGFAFSSNLGFANAIYANGLSPLTKGGPQNFANCTRDPNTTGCFVGTCPSPCSMVPTQKGPECQDAAGNICTVYQPVVGGVLGTNNNDLACREFLNNVRGPTSSSWATALTSANVGRGASLCLNYDSAGTDGVNTGVPFLAINARRNIVAINAFPPDAVDIQKFWFGCVLGDTIQYLAGDTNRCPDNVFCQ